jgi:DNA-binding response OmpR family regulator
MSTTTPRCVIAVEDDLLANFVRALLDQGEYETRRTRTVAESLEAIQSWEPHLALVQLELGDGRGAELIGQRGVRGPIPVIVLASRGSMQTRLDAFQRGADDVLTIPFPPEELVARALSLVMRRHGITVRFRPSIKRGELELDILAQKITLGDREIPLTERETNILYVLSAAAGECVSREDLMRYLYGDDAQLIASNVIDRHVSALRAKLRDAGAPEPFIETARDGYVMRTKPAQ